MAAAENLRFGWFRYTADDGTFWAVRTDKEWGALAASGLAAFNAADKAFPNGNHYRKRTCLLNDPNTGINTKRVMGTQTATCGVRGTAISDFVRGSAGLNAFTSVGFQPERTPKTKPIISPPDATTA